MGSVQIEDLFRAVAIMHLPASEREARIGVVRGTVAQSTLFTG
jgi:hypothetical protein